jgi:hypothetical protein
MSDSNNEDVNPAARRSAVGARRPFYRRRKSCPFSAWGTEDRLQGCPPLSRPVRARQDRAEPDHGGVGQEAASWRSDWGGALPGTPALHRAWERTHGTSGTDPVAAWTSSARWASW